MGIVKVSDELHDEIRKFSTVMSRSMNAQAEFWIKIGRLAELNPTLTFQEILKEELLKEQATGIDSMVKVSSEVCDELSH